MRRLKTAFIISMVLLAALPAVAADQVTLRNGDRLTGAVLDYDGTLVRMKTDMAGTVRIPWDNVATLATETPLAVTLSAAPELRVVTGTLETRDDQLAVHTASGTVTIARDEVETIRTEKAQADYESRLHPPLYRQWEGAVDAGLSSTRGNSESTTVSVGLDAHRETRQDKITTYFNLIFSRDETSLTDGTFANALRAGGRYDYNLTQKLFTFGLAEAEFDQLQELDLRSVLGGGFGWRLIDRPNASMEIFGGSTFNQEYFKGEPARRTAEGLAGTEVSWKVTRRTTLKQRLQFFPNLNERGEYRVTLDASAVHKLSQWLSWQATISNRFLSNPPPDRERNDLLFTTGIRVTFGATGQ